MKKLFLSAAIAVMLIYSCTDTKAGNKNVELKTFADSVAYSIGILTGGNIQNMEKEGFDLNLDAMIDGLHAKLKDEANVKIDDTTMRALMSKFQMDMQQKAMENQKKEADNAKAAGDKFLAENKTKEGVKVTASGIQYKVIKEGTGKSPNATSTVNVHYHGTFADGKVFDSSVERGEPIEFQLDKVIPGWTEGIQLMKEGGKTIFYIPSDLAYGPQGRQGIPGNSMLIFEVELFEVK